jgi:hypothetical protein
VLEEKIQTGAVIATTNASLGVGAYLASERNDRVIRPNSRDKITAGALWPDGPVQDSLRCRHSCEDCRNHVVCRATLDLQLGREKNAVTQDWKCVLLHVVRGGEVAACYERSSPRDAEKCDCRAWRCAKCQ